MNQLETKKQIVRLSFLFTMTYMVSYITRINYGAIISEMEFAMQVPKSQISIAVTASFITYGAGQIVSGVCGDRFSPKRLVFYGLITSSGMNFLLPLCTGTLQMVIVWCINGFAQAFMWPPMVRLMAVLLSEHDYNNAVVKVSWGSSFGTIAVYLLSPLLISVFNWKSVFFFSAVCGLVMAIIWNRYSYDVDSENQGVKVSYKGINKILVSPLMLFIIIAIILQGMLRDGVTTWMPSYISETYNITNMISILTGVTLPLLAIICLQLSSKLYIRFFKNPLLCSGIIFGLGTIAALNLVLFTNLNPIFSVIMTAVFAGCMHGVNLMLICMIPPYFKRFGNVSTVSGILNFCTYIGSAMSTYGIAVISEKSGWNHTLFIWMLIAAAGTIICLSCSGPWKNKMNETQK